MTNQEAKEYRRQQVIEKAVDSAHRHIIDGSEGTVEETNLLTAEVAKRLLASALNPFQSAMLAKDLSDPKHNDEVE